MPTQSGSSSSILFSSIDYAKVLALSRQDLPARAHGKITWL